MQRQYGNGVLAAILAARRKPRISCGGERGTLGRVGLIQRLIQRILVDVAVERGRVDVAVVGVARIQQAVPGAVAGPLTLNMNDWLSVVSGDV